MPDRHTGQQARGVISPVISTFISPVISPLANPFTSPVISPVITCGNTSSDLTGNTVNTPG